MILFDHVSKNYQNHEALSHVSFSVASREMVFLTGHSGAGKTTALKLMLRIEDPSQGQIYINQQHIQRLAKRQIPLLRRQINRRVHAALDKVGLLSKEKLLPSVLSCGEQQRVNIARAVVNKPTILLADEPTGNLDPSLSMGILRLFEAFNAVGVTVLIATHDLPLIAKMQHRIITLKQGQVIQKRNNVSE